MISTFRADWFEITGQIDKDAMRALAHAAQDVNQHDLEAIRRIWQGLGLPQGEPLPHRVLESLRRREFRELMDDLFGGDPAAKGRSDATRPEFIAEVAHAAEHIYWHDNGGRLRRDMIERGTVTWDPTQAASFPQLVAWYRRMRGQRARLLESLYDGLDLLHSIRARRERAHQSAANDPSTPLS